MKREVWVYLESSEDGKLSSGSKELLAQGKTIAYMTAPGKTGLRGILAGGCAGKLEDAAREALLNGAGEVTVIEGEELDTFSPECYSDAVAQLLARPSENSPSVMLFGRSPEGMDLGPALAARLNAGMLSDCVDASPAADGIVWERHAFGGTAVAALKFRDGDLPLVSVRPGSLAAEKETGKTVEECHPAGGNYHGIDSFSYVPVRKIRRPSLIRVMEAASGRGADIGSADVIVAGGNGAGPEGFALIQELADLLHGAVGASRIAVDKGWAPHSCLIGQSGRTVAPRLYINCGISGSVQHIVGMRDAACVVSINKDPRALIFNVSDYGIVGDLHRVLPEMIAEIRRSRN